MPTCPPRTDCMAVSESPRISRPSKSTLPEIETLASRTKPSIEYIATLLPEPDSPTMPSTSFAPTSKDSPSTAWTMPWRVEKETERSRTLSTASVVGVSSDNADPRVDVGVEHVDDGAREYDGEGAVHHAAHDERQIQALESLVGEEADTRESEDDFGQQGRSADEYPDVQSKERDDRDHRTAQRVSIEDPTFREALRSRGADGVLVQGVDQFTAQDPGVDTGVQARQRHPREHQVREPLPGAHGERHVPTVRYPGEY